jgi:hypothetical protein
MADPIRLGEGHVGVAKSNEPLPLGAVGVSALLDSGEAGVVKVDHGFSATVSLISSGTA